MDDAKRVVRSAERQQQRSENKASGEAWIATVDGYFGFLQTGVNLRIIIARVVSETPALTKRAEEGRRAARRTD
jgi:hypothetical protein